MSKIAISLTVNGTPEQVLAEPREQLADLLRGGLLLTGTHVGCEHGVCGACTVEIDGVPARSCITHAGACDGASVRTIEGFVAIQVCDRNFGGRNQVEVPLGEIH